MVGKQLIEKDLIRCIGDRRSTEVWGEPWISGIFPFSIERPNNIIAGDMRVCDLLDDMGSWRVDVLDFIFPSEVCRRIMSIRLVDVRREDRWNWLWDAKGEFTVKQCYTQAMKEKMAGDRSLSQYTRRGTLRVLEENMEAPDQLGMCVIALYLIWESRNAKRFSEVDWQSGQLWCKVAAIWDEFQDSKSWKMWNDAFEQHLRWTKLEVGWVKMNTNAGTLPEGGGVIRGLIRDSDGVCCAAFSKKMQATSNPLALEAEAAWRWH
ncbi:uncharacterized protein G2W53_032766 [Senna tora]|uniref:RNase H type-1 domain-containing protein n=1 Tax=Senna tora TaxID=362788 RepID=A0A834W6K8_9FABA|nr:uncharacterized protein G2W53_032766 [Senna tora]